MALIALGFLVVLFLVAIFARLLEPFDPDVQDLSASLQGPGAAHFLGTDLFGRDMLSRLIAATPITLSAAAQGLGIAVVGGVPLGLAAGFLGRAVDAIASRVNDALLAMPPLILALAIVGVLGRGLSNAMIAIGIVLAPRFYRIARGAAQSISAETYAEAARADGVSSWRLLWRHVLPNASGPLLIQVSFGIGAIITAEAGLSFLGLGVQPPQSSWGSMMRDAFGVVRQDSFPLIAPSVLITTTGRWRSAAAAARWVRRLAAAAWSPGFRATLLAGLWLLAMAVGTGIAYALHVMKPIVSSVRAVNEMTGFPVLGVVSVAFPSKAQSEFRSDVWRFSAAAACLMLGLAVALTLNWAGARLAIGVIKSLVST